MILAGDIGGTKTNVALFNDELKIVPGSQLRFPSGKYPSLEAVLDAYLAEKPASIAAAGFGVAGPVKDGKTNATNLPWQVDVAVLASKLGVKRVALVNDLVANAYGIRVLPKESFHVIQAGTVNPVGNQAIVSPGTGLGQAALFWNGSGHVPSGAEGGHTDFAPRDDVQIDLLRWLQREFCGRATYERVACGPGLWNIYRFLRQSGRHTEPEWLAAKLEKAADKSPVVSAAAMEGTAPIAVAALDIWVNVLAAYAGNFALMTLCTAGLYLGGGIVPRILPKVKSDLFLKPFSAKGPMGTSIQTLLQSIPVTAIENDDTALYGAAVVAREAL